MFFSASATSSRLAVLSILKSRSPPDDFDDEDDEGGDWTLFFLVEFLGLTGETIFFPPIGISSC